MPVNDPSWSLSSVLLAPAFSLLGSPVTLLELVAFAMSLAMVVGNLRVKVWAWPLAIAASACYGWLFAASRLYGEAALQLFFIAVSVWGWRQWAGGTAAPSPAVRWMSARGRAAAAIGTLAAWPVLGLLLAHGTDSDVPYADALATVASVTGQLLLGRKFVETWWVWLGVNLYSIGLFAHKQLWLTAVLYALFALLSVLGWRAWRARALRQAAGGAAATHG